MSTVASEPGRPSAGRWYVVVGTIVAVVAFVAAASLASLPLLSQGTTGTKIVVAKNPISARTRIQLADLTTMSYAPAPPGSFSDPKLVEGKGARVDLTTGAPITANLLVDAPDLLNSSDVVFLPIPQGWVAVQIPTSEEQGVGGYVQVGDRITVLASINTSSFGQVPGVTTVRTVFSDVSVLRVGPATGQQPGTQATNQSLTSSLTVLVTACDSEYLDWLLTNASLKYELESPKDYGAFPTGPVQACPKPSSAKGVGPEEVDSRWHFTTH